MNEWLPTLVGDITPSYKAYNPDKNPAVSFLYAGAVKFFFLTLRKYDRDSHKPSFVA